MSLPRKGSMAFTLLELIVALIILAVLAAIAVPTFGAVIDRSKDESTKVSLSSFAREVQAHAAFRSDGAFSPEDFDAAAEDFEEMAAAPGASAAGLKVQVMPYPINAARFEAEGLSVVSYALSDNARTAGLAAISASGKCVGAQVTPHSVINIVVEGGPEACNGLSVLTGVIQIGTDPDPSAPAGLVAPQLYRPTTGAATTSTAAVNWYPVPNATGYVLHSAASSDMRDAVEVYRGTALTATLPARADEVRYVRAVALQGTTRVSDPSNVLAVTALPAAPQNVAVKVTDTIATVTWSSVLGADGYYVYRDGASTIAATATGNGTTSQTFTLTAGQSASFAVRAYNAAGLSAASASVTGAGVPTAPTGVSAAVTGTTATVSWEPVVSADGYYVYQDGAATFAAAAAGGSASSVTIALAEGQTSSFVVRAYNAAGLSAASESSSATAVPTPPAGVTATVTGSVATVTWNSSAAANGYHVYRDGVDTIAATTVGTGSTSVSFTLVDGETASFVVRAYNAAGISAASAAAAATVVPAAPTNVAASVDGATVFVTWNTVSGATSYDVFRDGSSAPTAVTSPSAQFPISSGQTATFHVKAKNSGGSSLASETVSATAVPAVPQNVRASVSGTAATVTWDAVPGANGYYVYRDGGDTIAATAVGNGTTSQTFTVSEGSTASFVLRAYNAGGTSAASSSVAATAVPSVPQNVRASVSGPTATVTWDAVPGANGYHVYRNGTLASTVTSGSSAAVPMSAGATDSFAVRSYNSAGMSAASAAVSVTAAPAVPQSVRATVSGTTATVAWDAVSGATSYEVFRDGSTSPASTVTATSVTFTLAEGQTSTFSVRSRNAGGPSAVSSAVSATAVPAAPTNVAVSVTDTLATVSWTPSAGAEGYYVYQDGSSTIAATAVGGPSSSQTFVLAEGQTATFVVRAYNSAGVSAASESVTATVAPASPSGLVVSVSGTTATLRWSAVSGATGYDIYRDGATSPTVSVTTTSASFTLSQGQTSTFYLRSRSGSTVSAPSNTVSATAVPAAPTNVSASATGTTVTVSWTPSAGSEGYYVYQDGSSTIAATVVGGSASSQTFTLAEGQTTSFVVRAHNAGGTSAASASTSATAVPPAPQNAAVTLSGSTATVTWSPSAGAAGYYIYRDGSGTVAATVVGGSSTSQTFTVSSGSSASFVVRAYNPAGTSAPSNSAAVTAAPAAPTGVAASMSGTTATVSWAPTSGANGYYVYRDGTLVTTLTSGSTTSASYTLSAGQTSSFHVRAYNDGGTSAASATVSATAVPVAPTNLTGSANGYYAASLSWTGSAGAIEYVIYRDGSEVKRTTATSDSAVPMSSGTTSSFHVRAYNAGGLSGNSNSVPVTTATPPPPAPSTPTGLAGSVSMSTATLSWNASSGASGYYVYRNNSYQGSTTTTTGTNWAMSAAGATDTFTVVAYNSGGSSAATNPGVSLTAAPPVPTNVSVSQSYTDDVLTVSWTGHSSATSYTVNRVSSTGATLNTTVTAPTTTHTTSGLVPGVTYTFKVSATNGAGTSALSAGVSQDVSYAGAVLSDGPAAYYRLNEASSNYAANAATSSTSTSAVLYGQSAYYTTGTNSTVSSLGTLGGTGISRSAVTPLVGDPNARSIVFGGGAPTAAGGYVDLNDTSSALTSGGFTLEAWVYPTDSGNWARIFEFANGTDNNNIIFGRCGTTTNLCLTGRIGAAGTGDLVATGGLPLNTWTHVAVTVSSTGTATIYVNGAASASGTGFDYSEVNRVYNFSARSNWSTQDAFFKGNMSELAIYHKVLTSTTIKRHYDAR